MKNASERKELQASLSLDPIFEVMWHCQRIGHQSSPELGTGAGSIGKSGAGGLTRSQLLGSHHGHWEIRISITHPLPRYADRRAAAGPERICCPSRRTGKA